MALVKVELEPVDCYRVTFEDRADGAIVEARCRLNRASEPPVATLEPNLFAGWMGDAESIRSVIAAVFAVDRARQLSLRDYGV